MTKLGGIAPDAVDDGDAPSWGTWEELILAFAVNRHGTASWDSIASELQKRTSDPNLPLTPQNCRIKYLDLERRYVAASNDDSDGGKSSAPLLEELRKLRVAELRREVQRYDLNIESLEMKVKGMEEEREKKSKRESDLEIKSEDEERGVESDSVVGEESEKDQLSVNESNSTDPEAEPLGTGDEKTEPAGTGAEEDRTGKTTEEPVELCSEPDRKPVREDSCNGSSNNIKKSDRKAKTDVSDEAAKENSDVQSSASRSRKEGCDTIGDEREHADQSQPLFDLLQAIRAHKLGSIFDRCLRIQETSTAYRKLILQHIDLETVETRLRQGWYSGSNSDPLAKFLRDILLLINNTLVFFPKTSAESMAAKEIRALVTREITNKNASSGKQSLSMSKKPDKPLILKPLIVCRKRSSIVAKASSSDKKLLQKSQLFAEKETRKTSSQSEEPTKRTWDDHNLKKTNVKCNTKHQVGKSVGSPSENQKVDSTNKKIQPDSKKRGAANFLNRMKQGSNNGDLLDALKNTPLVSNDGKGGSGSPKNDGEKEQVMKGKGSPGKRNVGRPPKKGKRGREREEGETPPGKQQQHQHSKKKVKKL